MLFTYKDKSQQGLKKIFYLTVGFSIFEIIIVLLLLVLLTSIVLPSLDIFTAVKLKKASFKIQGLIRETYGLAVFSGHDHRIIYDLERNLFFVERLIVNGKIRKGKNAFDKKSKIIKLKEKNNIENDELKNFSWKAINGYFGELQKLPSGIVFHGIWVEYLKKRIRRGRVVQYFFHSGYTQSSHITISRRNKERSQLTIIVEPLTGDSYIEKGEPKIENN